MPAKQATQWPTVECKLERRPLNGRRSADHSAAAQVENATVSLRDATDALTRAETLAKRSLISTQDVETARSTAAGFRSTASTETCSAAHPACNPDIALP